MSYTSKLAQKYNKKHHIKQMRDQKKKKSVSGAHTRFCTGSFALIFRMFVRVFLDSSC